MKYPISDGYYEIEIEKSKFISQIHFVKQPEEVKPIIKELKRMHPQANHVVSAFITGKEGEISGRSDDGEPSGTSGNPTLEALKGNKITGALITTIRYFGGIKLGTGGLVRAYAQAAKGVIAATLFQEIEALRRTTLVLDYSLYKPFLQLISSPEYCRLNEEFGEKITIDLQYPAHLDEELKAAVTDLTRAAIKLESTLVPSPLD